MNTALNYYNQALAMEPRHRGGNEYLGELYLEMKQPEKANERLAVSAKTVEQAEESATHNRTSFEQGLALSTQLIDSETALVAARVRRAEAESDQRIAVAALRKALALPQLDSGK